VTNSNAVCGNNRGRAPGADCASTSPRRIEPGGDLREEIGCLGVR
jgi:hypothetical protein